MVRAVGQHGCGQGSLFGKVASLRSTSVPALVFSQLDQHSGSAGRVQERDPLSLGAEAGDGIDEAYPRGAAPCECGIEVMHGKTDVMDTGTAFGDELANWRVGGLRLEQFDQRFSGLQAADACTIRIVESYIRQAEDVTIEGQDLAECVNGDADMGNAGWARWFVGHGECAGVVCAGA